MTNSAKPSLRVLGVDPGLRATGWGVVAEDCGTPQLLGCGVVAPNAKLPLAERLLRIEEGLLEAIARWHPDELAVEEPFVAENVRSAMAIGQARAVALLVAARSKLTTAQYSPAEVKQSVTGYGRSEKAQVQSMLCMELGLKEGFASADAADAIAVAMCHLARRKIERLESSRRQGA